MKLLFLLYFLLWYFRLFIKSRVVGLVIYLHPSCNWQWLVKITCKRMFCIFGELVQLETFGLKHGFLQKPDKRLFS